MVQKMYVCNVSKRKLKSIFTKGCMKCFMYVYKVYLQTKYFYLFSSTTIHSSPDLLVDYALIS